MIGGLVNTIAVPCQLSSQHWAFPPEGSSTPAPRRHHPTKAAKEGHRQARYFTGDLEASWVDLADMAELNRLEHENDLIGAHVLALGRLPTAQFLE